MSSQILDGPPWDQFVDEDEAYVRGQAGSLGSGSLGGWSQANLGGFFVEPVDPDLKRDVRALSRKVPALPGDTPEEPDRKLGH
jgi:hypothetical protein